MLEFSDKKVVGTITVPMEITESDIESIIVGCFEGGSNYWMGLNNSTPEWENKPKGEPLSMWATKLLIDGKQVLLYDIEDEEEDLVLTLDKLLEGIKLNAIHRTWDSSIEDGDSITTDCILQYAVFGKVVFG